MRIFTDQVSNIYYTKLTTFNSRLYTMPAKKELAKSCFTVFIMSK